MRRQFYVIDFWIPPSKPAPGSKRCLRGSSGGSAIDFRTSINSKIFFGKVMNSGIVEDTYIFDLLAHTLNSSSRL